LQYNLKKEEGTRPWMRVVRVDSACVEKNLALGRRYSKRLGVKI
jgi:hypothetical protein